MLFVDSVGGGVGTGLPVSTGVEANCARVRPIEEVQVVDIGEIAIHRSMPSRLNAVGETK